MLDAALAQTPHRVPTPFATCRSCGAPLEDVFADLGVQPLCESYVDEAGLHAPEVFYPLRTYVCREC
ncbi:MAG TPA: hypothetical protein VFF10_02205, partial [Trueperaceae bacterium]|nr:hypothetical protein [Trueperaceae bacterium]